MIIEKLIKIDILMILGEKIDIVTQEEEEVMN